MNSYLLFDPTLPEVSTLLEGLDQTVYQYPLIGNRYSNSLIKYYRKAIHSK